MRKTLFSIALSLCASTAVRAQIATEILPADRMTTWRPGVYRGIPARTTVCANLAAATYGNGAQDASVGLQAAIDRCPDDQVVLLSAGTFTVNTELLINKAITLRGAGPGATVLRKTNGARPRLAPHRPVDPATYEYDPRPIVVVGPSRWPSADQDGSRDLSADGQKGTLSITVANTAGLTTGQFVLLDELSGASWQPTPRGYPGSAKVWRGDRVAWAMHFPLQMFVDDSQYSDAAGPYDLVNGARQLPQAMSWFSRPDRVTNEIKEIAAVVGNTVTFTTPLHISYRTSHKAQLTTYTGPNALVRNAGVERLTLIGGADGQVRFENAAYSWAKEVENTQWLGEGFAVDGSFGVEIRDSYVHEGSWPQPGGAGYAISFASASSEALIENNIVVDACKVMVFRASGAGTVVGYNYTDDPWNFGMPDWVEVGLNASHMAGPHHVLFEGNYSPNADSDYTHGNAIYLTFFRNWLSGQRGTFVDNSNVRAVGLAYGSWWDSFVGNVLGRAGQMTGWSYESQAMSGTNAVWTDRVIWKLGYDPTQFDYELFADPDTLRTVIRDGNYDYLTNSVHWHNTPGGYTIPNSLYLGAKPQFFGANPWPWVDPAAGKTYILPAQERYRQITGDKLPTAPTNLRIIK